MPAYDQRSAASFRPGVVPPEGEQPWSRPASPGPSGPGKFTPPSGTLVRVESPAAHQAETDPVHQADPATARGRQSDHPFRVRRCFDPVNLQGRQGVVAENGHRRQTDAALKQGHRVAGVKGGVFVEQLDPGLPGGRVKAVIGAPHRQGSTKTVSVAARRRFPPGTRRGGRQGRSGRCGIVRRPLWPAGGAPPERSPSPAGGVIARRIGAAREGS